MSERIAENARELQKWIVVALLWAVACLNYMDRMTIFSIFPLLQREMLVSNVALAMLGSVFLWAYGLFSPLGGYLGDRFSRKIVVLCSVVLFSMVTFATGLAHTQHQLIALRVLLGVSEAVFLPAALAHVAEFHSNATRSLANALTLTGFPAGAGLGGFYGGFMAEHYSWRAGFYLLGAVGFLLGLVLLLFLPRDRRVTPEFLAKREHSESALTKFTNVFRNRTAACLVFLAVGLSLSSWPTGTWMPTYFHERFGLSLTQSGATMAVFTYLPALVGSFVGGMLADSWAKHNPRGRINVQVIALGFMTPAMLAVGFVASSRELSYSMLVYSVARGMLEVNTMPIFSRVLPPERWATAYGSYNMAGTLAGSLGILCIGYTKARWGVGLSLAPTSLFLFAAMVVMWRAPLQQVHPAESYVS